MPCLKGKGRELAMMLPLSSVVSFDAFRKISQPVMTSLKILDPGALVVNGVSRLTGVGKSRKRNHIRCVPLTRVFFASWVFSVLSSKAQLVPVGSILNKNIPFGVAQDGISKSLSFLLLTWLFP